MWASLRTRKKKEAPHTARPEDPLLDLANRAERGERVAQNELLLCLAPRSMSVARKVLGPHHPDLHDVVQDSAWKLLKALPSFQRQSSVAYFSSRIALLTALSVKRREALHQRKLQVLTSCQQLDHTTEELVGPEVALSRSQCVTALRGLLGRLPEEQAEAIGLHYVVGMTALEVAEVTAQPLETVRTRLKSARRELRRAILEEPHLKEVLEVQRG